jgi:hypothetical protein
MALIPLPKSYLEKLLKPVNRLTESCVLNVNEDSLYTICSSTDSTVILYAKAKLPINITPSIRLNLISIKKLLSGLECLGDNGIFTIESDVNFIKCQNEDPETTEKTFFKYHLVDDSVVKEAPVNINKIASLKFDTEFVISTNKIKQLMSGYAFASDLTKIYFSTKEEKVTAEINDKTLQNVDHINLVVASSFSGDAITDPIPLSLEVFKNLAHCKTDIKVRLNTQYKVFIFQNKEEENIELKYIISALVK